MRILSRHTCKLIILFFIPFFLNGIAQASPQLRIVVVRLEYQSLFPKRVYEFVQPYRKVLSQLHEARVGELLVHIAPAGDFGGTTIRHRLSGQHIYEATTIFSGRGKHLFPTDDLAAPSWPQSNPVRKPRRIEIIPYFDAQMSGLNQALTQAMRLLPSGFAGASQYDAVAYVHFYSEGVSDPSTAEWVFFFYTIPSAPLDAAIIAIDYPKGVACAGIPTRPEVTVHNFSDVAKDFLVTLQLREIVTEALFYEEVVSVDNLQPDDTRKLFFREWVPKVDAIQTAALQMAGDAFPDNNLVIDTIRVSSAPVFRIVRSSRQPGSYPLSGYPTDFDDDGDVDFFVGGFAPQLLQNDSHSGYVDITDQSDVKLFPHTLPIAVADFTGDGRSDMLTHRQFLTGLGDGRFEDASEASGIVPLDFAAVFDLDSDGDLDVLTHKVISTGPGAGDVLYPRLLMLNDGSGRFLDQSELDAMNKRQPSAFVPADIDNDGDVDFFDVSWSGEHSLWLNDGRGRFTPKEGPWNYSYGRDAKIFDFDGDGRLDIYVTIQPEWSAVGDRLFRQKAELEFEDVTASSGVAGRNFSVDAADFDEDGDADLLLSGFEGLKIFVNEGNGAFSEKSELFTGLTEHEDGPVYWGTARWIDLNGDGDLDVYADHMVLVNTKRGADDSPLLIYHEGEVPRLMELDLNYPNPFRSSTTLQYRLFESNSEHSTARLFYLHVELTIFNLMGQQIRRMVSATQPPGVYTVSWDGNNDSGQPLPAGVYFCRLQAGPIVKTRKLTLLR